MSKLIKILLFDSQSNTVLVGNKFLETIIESRDEVINNGPSLGALIPVTGLPGLVPVPISSPNTVKVSDEDAAKNAAIRKLREYNLNVERSRLSFQTLTAEDSKYVYIVCYKLTDSEKAFIQNKSYPFVFHHINSLPTGILGIDAGIAYFITNRFDIIRNTVYLGDPRVIFPSSIVTYNPYYPIPYFSSYMYPQVVRSGSTYVSSNQIFGDTYERHERHSRSKSPSRSSTKSYSGSSTKSKKERKQRDKYKKYKQKYLELKAKIDKL